MAIPSSNDLRFYTNKPLTKDDWSVNFLKIISWLTDGTADIYVNSITIATGSTSITGFKRCTTAERDALTNIQGGSAVYNTDINMVQYYDGLEWKAI